MRASYKYFFKKKVNVAATGFVKELFEDKRVVTMDAKELKALG